MNNLTLKKLNKLYKEADIIWQDQTNENVFYFAKERYFYINYPKKKNGDYDMRYSVCRRDRILGVI